MNKKLLLISSVLLAAVIISCNKTTTLPAYTPAVTTNFSAKTLNHTKDSVNVGDTIYLNATGIVYDTTKNISVFFTSTYTASGVSSVYNYGSAAAPVKVNRVIGAQTNGVYAWSATIPLIAATNVPHKTALTIVGNFTYQLSFSSQQGNLSVADVSPNNSKIKTVYVK